MGLSESYLMQGFAPADEALLFRQKCPKPFSPVRGPKAVPPPPSRIKMARELAALKQPSPRGRFGAAAPPRTKAGKHARNTSGLENIGMGGQTLPKLNTHA